MKNNKFNKHKLLPFDTIKAATLGNIEAMSAVTQHFGGYIATLSIRPIKDEYGNERYGVDENIRSKLRANNVAKICAGKTVPHRPISSLSIANPRAVKVAEYFSQRTQKIFLLLLTALLSRIAGMRLDLLDFWIEKLP